MALAATNAARCNCSTPHVASLHTNQRVCWAKNDDMPLTCTARYMHALGSAAQGRRAAPLGRFQQHRRLPSTTRSLPSQHMHAASTCKHTRPPFRCSRPQPRKRIMHDGYLGDKKPTGSTTPMLGERVSMAPAPEPVALALLAGQADTAAPRATADTNVQAGHVLPC